MQEPVAQQAGGGMGPLESQMRQMLNSPEMAGFARQPAQRSFTETALRSLAAQNPLLGLAIGGIRNLMGYEAGGSPGFTDQASSRILSARMEDSRNRARQKKDQRDKATDSVALRLKMEQDAKRKAEAAKRSEANRYRVSVDDQAEEARVRQLLGLKGDVDFDRELQGIQSQINDMLNPKPGSGSALEGGGFDMKSYNELVKRQKGMETLRDLVMDREYRQGERQKLLSKPQLPSQMGGPLGHPGGSRVDPGAAQTASGQRIGVEGPQPSPDQLGQGFQSVLGGGGRSLPFDQMQRNNPMIRNLVDTLKMLSQNPDDPRAQMAAQKAFGGRGTRLGNIHMSGQGSR